MPDGKKTAILMVHFGTTYDDTRALTIDAVNEKAQKAFPDVKVVEAYTSRIIINRLNKRGITKATPKEALLRLASDGFTHVVVQGTNVIDGIEAEVLRNEAAMMAPFFEEIRVGRPLLYSVEDCEKVTGVLASRYKDATAKNGAVVLIGHGTSTPANAMHLERTSEIRDNSRHTLRRRSSCRLTGWEIPVFLQRYAGRVWRSRHMADQSQRACRKP